MQGEVYPTHTTVQKTDGLAMYRSYIKEKYETSVPEKFFEKDFEDPTKSTVKRPERVV